MATLPPTPSSSSATTCLDGETNGWSASSPTMRQTGGRWQTVTAIATLMVERYVAKPRAATNQGGVSPGVAARLPSPRLETGITFFDFPAEHWIHLWTTKPIKPTIATVKGRTNKTKGAGSRKAGLAMASRLLLASEGR